MSTSPNPAIEAYGWEAVPRKVETLLSESTASSGPTKPTPVSSIKLPDSELSVKVREYAQRELPIETFHHSMRVYYYGIYIPSRRYVTERLMSKQVKQSFLKHSQHGVVRASTKPIF